MYGSYAPAPSPEAPTEFNVSVDSSNRSVLIAVLRDARDSGYQFQQSENRYAMSSVFILTGSSVTIKRLIGFITDRLAQ
jgi:hypothetical protein